MKRRGAVTKEKPSQLRIIGGEWRGRKLSFHARPGLRPTSDRVRETLFNWLAPTIVGADCLLICTEWSAFRTPDFEVMETVMNGKVIFDGRNLYETSKLAKLGWTYRSIGRPTLEAQP